MAVTGNGWTFRPRRVLFEEAALDYDLGRRLWLRFTEESARPRPEVRVIPSHNRVTGLPGDTPAEAYREAKRTLVVGVRKGLNLKPCHPSADYQLPLVTSCPGLCEYCYLQTTLGPRPYIRVYVNVDDILATVAKLVAAGGPGRGACGSVSFEGAAVGDPIPVEPLTGVVARAVAFFAKLRGARFRFVTKFPDVGGLLEVEHGGRTRARVTVNTERIISRFDRGTPGLDLRLATLLRLAEAGYPVGAMVAPVFLEGDWERDYGDLFRRLAEVLPRRNDGGSGPGPGPDGRWSDGDERRPTLEVVTHRFTPRARSIILQRHPETRLPMDVDGRQLRRGQFGYFKYLYSPDRLARAREVFAALAASHLPHVRVDYIV